MLLVCMKCVNCSILCLIPFMLQFVYAVCSGVCSIVLSAVRGAVRRRRRWWLGWSRGLMSPLVVCVCCVSGRGVGGLAEGGVWFLSISSVSGA